MNAPPRVLAAFSEEQVERLTGISISQLRYWDRTAFYSPSYSEENRRIAYSRAYSFKDIVSLRVIHSLRNQYKISLQHLRDVSERLCKLGADPDRWTRAKLYPINGRVAWHEEGTKLPQIITSGQYLVAIDLSDVVQATKSAVAQVLELRNSSQIGKIEKSRYIARNAAVIAGTRIPAGAIQRFAKAGYSTADILREYPDITEADVEAALSYQDPSAAA